jgi:hypothetical protein
MVADVVVLPEGAMNLMSQDLYGEDDLVFREERVSWLAEWVWILDQHTPSPKKQPSPIYTAFRMLEQGRPVTCGSCESLQTQGSGD